MIDFVFLEMTRDVFMKIVHRVACRHLEKQCVLELPFECKAGTERNWFNGIGGGT